MPYQERHIDEVVVGADTPADAQDANNRKFLLLLIALLVLAVGMAVMLVLF